MPDQSSAASEHTILQEITAPLETLPDDAVAAVHADFPVALRGYDRLAVDAYVKQTSQLVAELQATRSPEAAVRKALERVGEQISGILQRAHETAEEITTQSRREGEERLEHARAEAAEIVAAARQRVKDLDADTDRIWIERHRIVDDARELAQQLTALADSAAARFPEADEAAEATEVAPESPTDVAAGSPAEVASEEATDVAPEPPTDVAADDREAATAVYDQVDDAGGEQGEDEPERRDTASHPAIPPASDAATRRADQ
jgi:cell division septum initiation protein DivIVA